MGWWVFRSLRLMSMAGLVIGQAALASPVKSLSPRAQECAVQAASYHSVNPHILMAIALVESSGKANTVAENTNNSIDMGLVGTNSVHFDELITKGVAPADLLDECVSLYVGAWMYSKRVHKYGNTWQAVGAYHSKTPSKNAEYQRRVFRKLVEMGAFSSSTEVVTGGGHQGQAMGVK